MRFNQVLRSAIGTNDARSLEKRNGREEIPALRGVRFERSNLQRKAESRGFGDYGEFEFRISGRKHVAVVEERFSQQYGRRILADCERKDHGVLVASGDEDMRLFAIVEDLGGEAIPVELLKDRGFGACSEMLP